MLMMRIVMMVMVVMRAACAMHMLMRMFVVMSVRLCVQHVRAASCV
jgi:hypothetical protein